MASHVSMSTAESPGSGERNAPQRSHQPPSTGSCTLLDVCITYYLRKGALIAAIVPCVMRIAVFHANEGLSTRSGHQCRGSPAPRIFCCSALESLELAAAT